MGVALMKFRWWILITVCLLGIGFVTGLAFTLAMPAAVGELLSEELAALEQLGEMLSPFSAMTVLFIFLKNVSTLLLSFLLSPILCLFPVLALLFNGVLVGFVSVIATQQESIWFVLAGLLPHGIFEIPALVMGEAAALSFGAVAILALFSQKRRELLIPTLKQNLRYLAIASILLVPAAIIETFLTPYILQLF